MANPHSLCRILRTQIIPSFNYSHFNSVIRTSVLPLTATPQNKFIPCTHYSNINRYYATAISTSSSNNVAGSDPSITPLEGAATEEGSEGGIYFTVIVNQISILNVAETYSK
jgi:hypothetical protein